MPRSRNTVVRRSNCARVPNSSVTGLLAANRSASGRYPSSASTDFFTRGGIGGLRDFVGFARLGFFGIASSSRRLTTPDPPPRVAPDTSTTRSSSTGRPSAHPMNTRLLLLGAGSGAANNLVRSLRACDRSMAIIGAHHDRFVLRGAPTERRYLLPSLSHPGFVSSVNRLIAAERIDVLIPTSDADVRTLAATRASLGCRTLLPAPATIDLCQDKYAFAEFLFFFLMIRPPPISTLFPYTTLFRSSWSPPPVSWAFRRFLSHKPACRRPSRSEEHTSELQSRRELVCRLLLEKKK